MKNALFNFLVFCAFILIAHDLQAQPGGSIWAGSRSANPNANAVSATITKVYDAFTAGNNEKGWAAYTEEVAEIDPSGNITFGKKNLQESMSSGTVCNPCGYVRPESKDIGKPVPKNSFKINPKGIMVRMITNDIALAVWDIEFDCGQEKSGQSKAMAVLHKIQGSWEIEFSLVTEIGMPALDAARGH